MISRRTWVLLATVAFLFFNAYLSWPPKPEPREIGWDYSQLPSRPHQEWLTVGVLAATALGVSFVGDLIGRRRSRI
jgi:hypothetical protein